MRRNTESIRDEAAVLRGAQSPADLQNQRGHRSRVFSGSIVDLSSKSSVAVVLQDRHAAVVIVCHRQVLVTVKVKVFGKHRERTGAGPIVNFRGKSSVAI